jgi:hypothetical protein
LLERTIDYLEIIFTQSLRAGIKSQKYFSVFSCACWTNIWRWLASFTLNKCFSYLFHVMFSTQSSLSLSVLFSVFVFRLSSFALSYFLFPKKNSVCEAAWKERGEQFIKWIFAKSGQNCLPWSSYSFMLQYLQDVVDLYSSTFLLFYRFVALCDGNTFLHYCCSKDMSNMPWPWQMSYLNWVRLFFSFLFFSFFKCTYSENLILFKI